MHITPENARPKFIINPLLKDVSRWEDRLADPITMLKGELDEICYHIEIGDDRLPMVRVQFGTPQVAAAFGSEIAIPENNLPAAKTHPLKNIEDIYKLQMPLLDAGWYGKLKTFTDVFKENLPESVLITHPDIQGPFNNAHLIRGNDILMDFYDNPEAVEALLDVVTDYMIKLVPRLKQMISDDKEWFYDWGAIWKGAARISNCSMQMISPELYTQYVYQRDKRLMEAIGGGRIHYCGKSEKVIWEFFKIPGLNAFEFDGNYLDFQKICAAAPEHTVVNFFANPGSKTYEELVKGNWPKKKNIVIVSWVSSIEQGKAVLKELRESIPEKD